jgi:hypothetical protein
MPKLLLIPPKKIKTIMNLLLCLGINLVALLFLTQNLVSHLVVYVLVLTTHVVRPLIELPLKMTNKFHWVLSEHVLVPYINIPSQFGSIYVDFWHLDLSLLFSYDGWLLMCALNYYPVVLYSTAALYWLRN